MRDRDREAAGIRRVGHVPGGAVARAAEREDRALGSGRAAARGRRGGDLLDDGTVPGDIAHDEDGVGPADGLGRRRGHGAGAAQGTEFRVETGACHRIDGGTDGVGEVVGRAHCAQLGAEPRQDGIPRRGEERGGGLHRRLRIRRTTLHPGRHALHLGKSRARRAPCSASRAAGLRQSMSLGRHVCIAATRQATPRSVRRAAEPRCAGSRESADHACDGSALRGRSRPPGARIREERAEEKDAARWTGAT